MSTSTQILPSPNPKGNVIAIKDDHYNSLSLYENDGTISVTKTNSLDNRNYISSGIKDGPAGPGET